MSDHQDSQDYEEQLQQLTPEQLEQLQQMQEQEQQQLYEQQYQQQQMENDDNNEGQHIIEIDGKQVVLTNEEYIQLMEEQGMMEGEQGEGEQQDQQQYDDDDDDDDDDEDEQYDSDAELYENEDELRKIRRDLLENLNRERKARNLEPMYPELLSNMVANKYALFLVDNEHNQQYFSQQLVKQHHLEGTFDQDYHLCYIQANYEVDVVKDKNYIYNYFMEMGYLFLEDQIDKQHILNSDINHIGLGVQLDKDKIVIVLILSSKSLAILQVFSDQQGFKIRGKVLKGQEKDKVQKDQGLFAVNVVRQLGDDLKDDQIRGSGPDKIQYNRNTKEFIVNMDQHDLDPVSQRCEKYLQFWTRLNPDSIPYGKKSRDSEKPISYQYLQFQLRVPCQPYPDPKYAQEDEAERLRIQEEQEKEYQEQQRQQELEQQKINEAMREQEGQFSDEGEEDSDENKDEDDEEEDEDDEDMDMRQEQKEPVISNKEIREDLERAINEAMIQHKEFMDQNLLLQQKIKQLRSRNEMYVERQNEMAMNDHKYLNTLAHVHQIRLDLQQTQKNYNMMSKQLKEKLEAKQKKCNEIKLAFMELKRQVCQKAAYSRNDKPIPERLITEWEEKEISKDKDLQQLRLDNLRLRNTLIKNQKVLKKKEELAEGLHLIDFEQLKIENQTLNEKIEERNEDLHKLKKKNTNTVQILTHTKEKLKFILAEKEKKIKQEDELNKVLGEARGKLKLLKKEKQQTLDQVLKYKQITGIAKSTTLTNDFNKLKDKVEELDEERQKLKESHQHMKDVLVEFENYKLKNMQMSQENGMY